MTPIAEGRKPSTVGSVDRQAHDLVDHQEHHHREPLNQPTPGHTSNPMPMRTRYSAVDTGPRGIHHTDTTAHAAGSARATAPTRRSSDLTAGSDARSSGGRVRPCRLRHGTLSLFGNPDEMTPPPPSSWRRPAGDKAECQRRVVPWTLRFRLPADVLVAASREADLLVLGRHSGSGLFAPRLGARARAVVAHAECPVMVVPV